MTAFRLIFIICILACGVQAYNACANLGDRINARAAEVRK